jgi:predicted RNA-binding Zn-ribbon protein involved in translation (DUF1610 family)
VATCPKCGAELGLRTSFALANIRNVRGIYPHSARLEYPCHRCGARLTYRYEVAGLFAVLALVPLMLLPALPSLGVGNWAFGVWALIFAGYWVGLAALFSQWAPPLVANPSLESDS